MTLHLNFSRNRKGIGTVFGMVFFLLITIIVFSSFMIILNQNTGLEQTVIKTRQMDNDKAMEQLTITQLTTATQLYTVSANSVTVNCNITNSGTLPVQVVRLWVEDLSNNQSGNLQISNPNVIIPQGSFSLFDRAVTVQGATTSDALRFWFITARGNQFTLQQSTGGISIDNSEITNMINNGISGVMGDFLPDYHSVEWAQVNENNGDIIGAWTQGWIIPSQGINQMVWRINVSYFGLTQLVIDQNSMLLYYPFSGQNPGGKAPPMSYIVNYTDSTNRINPYFGTEIIVSKGANLTLYFGSDGAPNLNGGISQDAIDQLGDMLTLVIYGQSPSKYAQSFPLFAIFPRLLSVSLDQNYGIVGRSTILTGTGFSSNSVVIITFDGMQVATTTTTGSGILSGVTFHIPPSTAGPHTVNAIDDKSNSAEVIFTVTPTITVNSQNGPINAPVVLSGHGFAASSIMTITFGGTPIDFQSITDATGSFTGTFNVPIDASVGINTIVATDSNGNNASCTFTVTVLNHFAFATIDTQTAGSAFSIAITAQDPYGNTVTSYTGIPDLTYSIGLITPSSIGPFVEGVATAQVIVTKSGMGVTITASDNGKTGTSNAFIVSSTILDHFSFNTINTPQVAGNPFSLTITAQDQYNNVVTSYSSMNSLTDSTGTINPTNTGIFSNGLWTGSITITQYAQAVTLITGGSSKSGTSNLFDVVNQVTFVSAGTGSGTTENPTPTYPSSLQANDLILLQVTVRNSIDTPTTPGGFTLLYGPDSTGTGRQWIYYKISTGLESGSLTVTISGSECKMARMYDFRNVGLSIFTEGGGFGFATSNTVTAQSVTTTGNGELAVSMIFVNDDNAVSSFTGQSGGVWIAVPEFTTTQGSDGCIQLQTATKTAMGTITGGTYSMASDPWGVRAFALKPV